MPHKHFEGWSFDSHHPRIIHQQGEPEELENHEFQVLCLLIANPNRIVTRDEILNAVWGVNEVNVIPNNVEQVISALRKKLHTQGADRDNVIKTEWNQGYRFVAHPDPERQLRLVGSRMLLVASATVVLLLLAGLVLFSRRPNAPAPAMQGRKQIENLSAIALTLPQKAKLPDHPLPASPDGGRRKNAKRQPSTTFTKAGEPEPFATAAEPYRVQAQAFEELIHNSPQNGLPYALDAAIHIGVKDYRGAFNLSDECLRKVPRFRECLITKGVAEGRLNQMELSRKALKEIIDTDRSQDSWQGWGERELIRVFLMEGKIDDAVPLSENIIAHHPEFAGVAHAAKAKHFLLLNDKTSALQEYAQAIDRLNLRMLEEGLAWVYLDRGRLLEGMGMLQNASSDFYVYHQLRPYDKEAQAALDEVALRGWQSRASFLPGLMSAPPSK